MKKPASQDLSCLVVYARYIDGEVRSVLGELIGGELADPTPNQGHVDGVVYSSAPVTSEVRRSYEERIEKAEGCVGGLGDTLIDWQPPADRCPPLPFETAVSCAGQVGDFSEEFRRDSQVQAYCLERCWAFLVHQGPFIPSGWAFFVDHWTRKVLEYRYIDVDCALRVRGFSTPETRRSGESR